MHRPMRAGLRTCTSTVLRCLWMRNSWLLCAWGTPPSHWCKFEPSGCSFMLLKQCVTTHAKCLRGMNTWLGEDKWIESLINWSVKSQEAEYQEYDKIRCGTLTWSTSVKLTRKSLCPDKHLNMNLNWGDTDAQSYEPGPKPQLFTLNAECTPHSVCK